MSKLAHLQSGAIAAAAFFSPAAMIGSQEAVAFEGQNVVLRADVTGSPPYWFKWYKDGAAIAGEEAAVLALENATSVQSGEYFATASNTGSEVFSQKIHLTVVDEKDAPKIVTAPPFDRTVVPSGSTLLEAVIDGAAPESLQWFRNGDPIPDATEPVLLLQNISDAQCGLYSLEVRKSGGTLRKLTHRVRIQSAAKPRLTNLSIRCRVKSEGSPLIAGCVISGGTPMPFLFRASGPALRQFDVMESMENPTISIHGGSGILDTNDDWWGSDNARTTEVAGQLCGAFPFPGYLSADAATVTTVAGSNSAHVSPKTGTPGGIILLEIYDVLKTDGAELLNLSGISETGPGESALTLGFAVEGIGERTFLFRGVGPGLGLFGIGDALENPVLELRKIEGGGDRIIARNDDWGSSADIEQSFQSAGAFVLKRGSKDAALQIDLPSGLYSITVSSAEGQNGRALAEIYSLR